jgi:hypothetical protein
VVAGKRRDGAVGGGIVVARRKMAAKIGMDARGAWRLREWAAVRGAMDRPQGAPFLCGVDAGFVLHECVRENGALHDVS